MPQIDAGYILHLPDGTQKGTASGIALVYRKVRSAAPVSCAQWAAVSNIPPEGLPPFSISVLVRDGNAGKPPFFAVIIWNYTGPSVYDLSNPKSTAGWGNGKVGQSERGFFVRGNNSFGKPGSGTIKVNADGSGTLKLEGFYDEPLVPPYYPRPASLQMIWACNDGR
jgi:hypothetical protein